MDDAKQLPKIVNSQNNSQHNSQKRNEDCGWMTQNNCQKLSIQTPNNCQHKNQKEMRTADAAKNNYQKLSKQN